MGADTLSHLKPAVFPGTIHLVRTESEADQARQVLRRERLVGLDTESRPSFRKGENFPISLVQIATDKDAFLFRVRAGAPFRGLKRLIEDPEITKIVQGAPEEIRELRRDLGIQARGFVDLPAVAKTAGCRELNLRALAADVLSLRVSKSAQRSDWSREELDRRQIEYAAVDAWACLAVYRALAARPGAPAAAPVAAAPVFVRPARRRDSPAIAGLFAQEGEAASPPAAREIRRWISTRGCGLLVAVIEGQVAGVLVHTDQPRLVERASVLWIETVVVGKSHRGRGVGNELIAAAIGSAQERGHGAVRVSTATDDRAGRERYREAGLAEDTRTSGITLEPRG